MFHGRKNEKKKVKRSREITEKGVSRKVGNSESQLVNRVVVSERGSDVIAKRTRWGWSRYAQMPKNHPRCPALSKQA